MGGTVAVTLRKPNGEEFRMNRWTNSLPDFFNDIKFFQCDEKHIDDYLSAWLSMKDDWERNKPGPYENNMTDFYEPYPGTLAPNSYGIVVFDFMNKAVVSSQGYTGFDHRYIPIFGMHDQIDIDKQVELFDAGMTTCVDYEMKEVAWPKSVTEFLELITAKNSLVKNIKYKTDFSIYNYHDNKAGMKKAYKKIKELGFKLTKAEEKEWKEFLKDMS